MKNFVAILLGLALCIASAKALSCVPCDKEKYCGAEPTVCDYGFGRDVCGCCNTCLNGPGEKCGGAWNEHGSCGEGLECVSEDYGDYMPYFGFTLGVCQDEVSRRKRALHRRRGRKLVEAKTHKHQLYGNIPAHILAALRKKGYKV